MLDTTLIVGLILVTVFGTFLIVSIALLTWFFLCRWTRNRPEKDEAEKDHMSTDSTYGVDQWAGGGSQSANNIALLGGQGAGKTSVSSVTSRTSTRTAFPEGSGLVYVPTTEEGTAAGDRVSLFPVQDGGTVRGREHFVQHSSQAQTITATISEPNMRFHGQSLRHARMSTHREPIIKRARLDESVADSNASYHGSGAVLTSRRCFSAGVVPATIRNNPAGVSASRGKGTDALCKVGSSQTVGEGTAPELLHAVAQRRLRNGDDDKRNVEYDNMETALNSTYLNRQVSYDITTDQNNHNVEHSALNDNYINRHVSFDNCKRDDMVPIPDGVLGLVGAPQEEKPVGRGDGAYSRLHEETTLSDNEEERYSRVLHEETTLNDNEEERYSRVYEPSLVKASSSQTLSEVSNEHYSIPQSGGKPQEVRPAYSRVHEGMYSDTKDEMKSVSMLSPTSQTLSALPVAHYSIPQSNVPVPKTGYTDGDNTEDTLMPMQVSTFSVGTSQKGSSADPVEPGHSEVKMPLARSAARPISLLSNDYYSMPQSDRFSEYSDSEHLISRQVSHVSTKSDLCSASPSTSKGSLTEGSLERGSILSIDEIREGHPTFLAREPSPPPPPPEAAEAPEAAAAPPPPPAALLHEREYEGKGPEQQSPSTVPRDQVAGSSSSSTRVSHDTQNRQQSGSRSPSRTGTMSRGPARLAGSAATVGALVLLEQLGLDDYREIFTSADLLDPELLLHLNDDDLVQLDLPLGARKRYRKSINTRLCKQK